jgi:hypothetical protein
MLPGSDVGDTRGVGVLERVLTLLARPVCVQPRAALYEVNPLAITLTQTITRTLITNTYTHTHTFITQTHTHTHTHTNYTYENYTHINHTNTLITHINYRSTDRTFYATHKLHKYT